MKEELRKKARAYLLRQLKPVAHWDKLFARVWAILIELPAGQAIDHDVLKEKMADREEFLDVVRVLNELSQPAAGVVEWVFFQQAPLGAKVEIPREDALVLSLLAYITGDQPGVSCGWRIRPAQEGAS